MQTNTSSCCLHVGIEESKSNSWAIESTSPIIQMKGVIGSKRMACTTNDFETLSFVAI